jgi:protein-disulfide isomerase
MIVTHRWGALVAALVLGAGCGGEQPPAGGPAASDEVVSERVIGYFEKTVTTPGLVFKVKDLADAEIPGWRKGNLEASLGERSQMVAFYVSRDGRYLLRGEAVDLTVDPHQKVMERIALAGQPVRGPEGAKVTIVEYSDFECPFCARVYETLENQVLKEYGDKVRFVFKNFPLSNMHPWAEDAALASECAFLQGNDQFWSMYNGLFAQQGDITKENLPEKAAAIAEQGGIDVAKLRECLAGRTALAAVKADEEEAAALGVNSTPTFFVNGRRLSGAQTYESFKQVIDQALGATG